MRLNPITTSRFGGRLILPLDDVAARRSYCKPNLVILPLLNDDTRVVDVEGRRKHEDDQAGKARLRFGFDPTVRPSAPTGKCRTFKVGPKWRQAVN